MHYLSMKRRNWQEVNLVKNEKCRESGNDAPIYTAQIDMLLNQRHIPQIVNEEANNI